MEHRDDEEDDEEDTDEDEEEDSGADWIVPACCILSCSCIS